MESWRDQYLGHVDMATAEYCKHECLRGIPRVLCCTPESPTVISADFLLYEANDGDRYYNLTWDDVNSAEIIGRASRYQSLVLATHGWLEVPSLLPLSLTESRHNVDWMHSVKDGYLQRGMSAVMLVYWHHGNRLDYAQSAANVRTVGMMIGHMLWRWRIHERTLAIGFSLGGQILGEAGKYVQRMTAATGRRQKIRECHGLDPGNVT